ncbi:MAG: exocyst complex component exo84 [Pycnora praestabilis]|nr:MAG: exocyst complex component exo84 [Pycnora praestabilis]
MEEKSKGISLRRKRTKKPNISAPKSTSFRGDVARSATDRPVETDGKGDGRSHLGVPRERPQLGGQTSDLVKRRYSTRFTQGTVDWTVGAPPVPSVPSIPNQFGGQQAAGRGGPFGLSHAISVDINAFKDPSLRPEQYVAGILSDASEQDIRDYQLHLRKAKNRTSTDLQQNVYQNRTQFIKISREAEKLKGEMRTLRSLMSELESTLNQPTPYNSVSRKKANRGSIADQEVLWNSQLQSLWKNIEGSQKFLPAIPGRHVLQRSEYWSELNAATWKPMRSVTIILLNDHLLVATQKRARMDQPSPNAIGSSPKPPPTPSKFVAQRCWPLQDIKVDDLTATSATVGANGMKKPREDLQNAIRVNIGRESFTFRHERSTSDEKDNLLQNIRKTVDELHRSLSAEAGETRKTRDSIKYLASRDPALSNQTALLENLSNSMSKDKPNVLIEVDGKPQNFRWVETQIDELDIDIALQRFEESVMRVEKLRHLSRGLKGNAIAQDLMNFKLDERASKLAVLVTRQLVDTHSYHNATQGNVGWLRRLGFEDRAREAYLHARSTVITKRTRQCIFEGDLFQYIFQLSFVYFTIIKNTVSIYQSCFPPLMMSACVKWAKEHVDGLNDILVRQLSSISQSSKVWTECMDKTREHAMMLTEVGMDFKDFVGRNVEDDSPDSGDGTSVGLGLQ